MFLQVRFPFISVVKYFCPLVLVKLDLVLTYTKLPSKADGIDCLFFYASLYIYFFYFYCLTHYSETVFTLMIWNFTFHYENRSILLFEKCIAATKKTQEPFVSK